MYEGASSSGTMTSGYIQHPGMGQVGGRALAQPDIAPARPVPHVMGVCSTQLGDLHEVLGELERRLGSVLMPVPPQGNGVDKGAPSPVRSELGDRLDQISMGIVAAKNRVVAVLDRLEV